MRIHRHIDAGAFLRHAESWLLESEPENNLILGVARQSQSQRVGDDTDEYWATVFEDGRVVGAAFRTPPYPLSVTRMTLSAVPMLIDDVAEVFEKLPGVTGPMAVAESFAAEWRGRYGVTYRVKFKTRVHVLMAVEALSDLPPGSLRQMTQSDEALIRGWMDEFARDVGVSVPPENLVRPLLEQCKFHLWEDSGPRSVVAAGRDTPSGACITTVYTPPAYRRRGYATASVASLSRKLLSTGKTFCCLYTDLDNPTSNSIYRKIGYEPVRDDVELEFDNS